MSQIKQVLRLHQQSYNIKQIARTVGMSKNTVKSYLAKVGAMCLGIDTLLALEDPVLESKFHSGDPAYSDSRFDTLHGKLEYYRKELEDRVVTRHRLWKEYRADHPDGYSLSQFRYHLSQHLAARKPSLKLSHQPGDALFIDFAGQPMSYVDPQTGEVVSCPVFVACLPYSDFGFALPLKSMKIEELVHAMTCCLDTLGGSPSVLVPDNMKTAVIKASRYEPQLNQVLEDLANHYGMALVPARVRHPKDKALVENQVKLIYARVYAPLRHEHFLGYSALTEAVGLQMKRHNQTRMQEKPWSREERFLSAEQPVLKPLPENPFEIKHYREHKVSQNGHVRLSQDKHYYSVPYRYIGRKMKVIYTRSMVRIYCKGEQVAVHRRSYKLGAYSTTTEHLCSHHQHYLKRSPAYYKTKAWKLSGQLYELFKAIFDQGRHPEQCYRTCDGLLRTFNGHPKQEAEQACRIAIDLQNYSWAFFDNLLRNKMTDQYGCNDIVQKPLPAHENVRGRDYYENSSSNPKP